MFDESYYKTGNYVNYLEKKEKYNKLASELFHFLNTICISNKDLKILDYGCALGHLLDGIASLGFKGMGYDISEWALQQASQKHKILNTWEVYQNKFDICFALDVLEHMNDEQVSFFLQNINCELLIFRIPVSTNGGKSFVLDVSNNDITHVNCREKASWKKLLAENNFNTVISLNLNSIYDSEGVFCGIGIKANNSQL